MKTIGTILTYLCLWNLGFAQVAEQGVDRGADVNREAWVDSVLQNLTTEQKIGQLFMIRAHSNLGADHIAQVEQQIRKYQVGGLCFFQGTPQKQAELTNRYQALSELPLLIAIDAEWGLGMRFREHGLSFPRQLMLGATQSNRGIYLMGHAIARQLKGIGVHVNFAPVADINNNPLNPVINDRSFGEDRYQVSAKSVQYMQGMQDGGLIACAKHFPGHGDTETDSHLDLPVIRHPLRHLDSLELYPFRVMIRNGVQSIMIAHLQVPALDSTPQRPTTLSAPVVKGLLRDQMGYKGLIFTDALEMKGVTKHHDPGEVELLAFLAGNDMLVLPEEIGVAVGKLKQAVQDSVISTADLDERVRRILIAKYNAGLSNYRPVTTPQVDSVLEDHQAEALKALLIEQALTLVKNTDDLVPVRDIQGRTFSSIMFGTGKETAFQSRLASYLPVKHFTSIYGTASTETIEELCSSDIVFAGITGMNKYATRDFGLSRETLKTLRRIEDSTNLVVVLFGSPYALKFFDGFKHVVVAYEDDPMVADLAAQALMGVFPFQGRLPVTASTAFRVHDGLMTQSLMRMGYTIPERVGVRSDSLDRIAEIVQEMMDSRAAPGCQIVVARKGRIVYQRAFGYHTYRKVRPVRTNDLYDLASITKIAGTTLGIMHLADQGKLDITHTLGCYLDGVVGTDKAELPIDRVLSHHAGLVAYIPFHEETIQYTRGRPRLISKYYKSEADTSYTIPVAKDIYLLESYTDRLWGRILESKVRPYRHYRYSDIGFYMLAELIRSVEGKRLDSLVYETYFKPLGLTQMCFNPHAVFPVSQIVPSEEDRYFRKQRIQGFVHDMGSAMLGGVAGHAGLFSNAGDLAVLMQMLQNGGYYGGRTYLANEIIDQFTTRVPYSSRRALGFDMKELHPNRRSFTCDAASESTYGHTGFTGTCVWSDPEEDLVFVFLSNRTYPSMRNNKLNKKRIRERIQGLVYNALFSTPSFSMTP